MVIDVCVSICHCMKQNLSLISDYRRGRVPCCFSETSLRCSLELLKYFHLQQSCPVRNISIIRYYISVQVNQTVVHRNVLHSEDCVHQLCTFIFTPNLTENAGTYRVVIRASDDIVYSITSFTIPQNLGKG